MFIPSVNLHRLACQSTNVHWNPQCKCTKPCCTLTSLAGRTRGSRGWVEQSVSRLSRWPGGSPPGRICRSTWRTWTGRRPWTKNEFLYFPRGFLCLDCKEVGWSDLQSNPSIHNTLGVLVDLAKWEGMSSERQGTHSSWGGWSSSWISRVLAICALTTNFKTQIVGWTLMLPYQSKT